MILKKVLQDASERIDQVLKQQPPLLAISEIGQLQRVEHGIASISGLPGVKSMELLDFSNGETGLAFNLDRNEVGAVLLSESAKLVAGSKVMRTGRVIDVPVGNNLLGRVVDSLGVPLDDLGPIQTNTFLPIESKVPEIMDRMPVTTPLETGIKVIDALIPIGRGQRQLILGDRQTGKTSIAVDTMLNQRDKNVLCVYCSIGQRRSAVARVVDCLRKNQVLEHSVIVVASGSDPAGIQYIAPYAATAIAEFFMQQGRDVLIIYDDLTRHAHAYRELALLLRRPPGREAYPGDIFYIHSRLLERSTHLTPEAGGGSLTAMPIIETQAQNISAYIPTNLISITDGQIYLSPDLFQKGQLPAVDVGKSVSRVGGKAQLPAYLDVAGELRLAYSQYQELETFARFGTRLDVETRKLIDQGRRVREILKQNEREVLTVEEQIMVLFAVNNGVFDTLPLAQISTAESALGTVIREQLATQCQNIQSRKTLSSDDKVRVLQVCRQVITEINI